MDLQHGLTQPSFEKFISTINQEQAKDLVIRINVFMRDFRRKPVDADSDSRAVQDFLASMAVAFSKHPLWAGSAPEELDAAIEGLEKYLLTKLYDRTFGVDPADRERDQAIGLRLQALQFIRPEHLEVAREFANDAALLLAQKELAKINMFKSPRDKLICILSCCRVITNLLASRKYGAGADDFTPVLIYVTIKAAPDALASNVAFIERFRLASRLVSEAQYLFVQMQSAVAFVEMLDVRTSLKVDQDELIAHMLAAGAMTEADLAMLQQQSTSAPAQPALHSQTSEQEAIQAVAAAEARAAGPARPQAAAAGARAAGAEPAADLIDFGEPEPAGGGGGTGASSSSGAAAGGAQQPPGAGPWGMQDGLTWSEDGTGAAGAGSGGAPAGAPSSPLWPADPFTPPPQQQQQPLQAPSAASASARPEASSGTQLRASGSGARLEAGTAGGRARAAVLSSAQLEARGARLLVEADAAGDLQERYPLLYASLDALTLADVRGLLVQYKELVLKYEALAMAVDQQHQQHQEHPAESDHSAGPATAQPSSTSLPALAAGWPSQQSLQPQLPPPPPPPPSQQQPPQPSPAHDDTAFTLSPLPPSCTATPERSAADLQALKGLGGSEG